MPNAMEFGVVLEVRHWREGVPEMKFLVMFDEVNDSASMEKRAIPLRRLKLMFDLSNSNIPSGWLRKFVTGHDDALNLVYGARIAPSGANEWT